MTTSERVAENMDIYNIDEQGPITGTVFQIVANNNLDIKINTLNNNNNNNLFYSCRIYTCFVIILAMPPLLDKRRLTDKALSLSEYSSVTNHTCYIQYSQCDIFISVLST